MAAAVQPQLHRRRVTDMDDYPELPASSRLQNVAHRNRMTGPQHSRGLVVASPVVFNLLLVTPLLCWFIALAWGMLQFKGIPARKRDVQHVMMWFDMVVFRTAAGPALPMVVLFIRAMATLGLITSSRTDAAKQQTQSLEMQPLVAGTTTTSSSTSSSRSRAQQPSQVVVQPGVRNTLLRQAAAVYVMVILGRMSLYVLHLAAQQLPSRRFEGVKPAAYMSDHVLLGASVLGCLQVELLCGISDLTKLSAAHAATWRKLIALLCCVLAAVLAACVTLDMHFTARFFHHPPETLAACVLGVLVFQVPLLFWVKRQRIS